MSGELYLMITLDKQNNDHELEIIHKIKASSIPGKIRFRISWSEKYPAKSGEAP